MTITGMLACQRSGEIGGRYGSAASSEVRTHSAPWVRQRVPCRRTRGSSHLVDSGVVLKGERDVFGAAVSTATLASRRTAGTAWTGGTWNGAETGGGARLLRPVLAFAQPAAMPWK